jgi:uncharacterized membrane protein YczE
MRTWSLFHSGAGLPDHDILRTVTLPSRLVRLMTGLLILAVSIVLQINARLGYAPWTVLDDGMRNLTGLTIGQANILMSAAIIAVDLLAREKIGFGTVANMTLLGLFTDWILALKLLPVASGLADGLLFLGISMLLVAVGVWLYIGAGFGAGPRDSLMMAAIRCTGKPLGFCRCALECFAVALGFALGGSVGVGTLMQSVLTGIMMQALYKRVGFNTNAIRHQSLDDLFRRFWKGRPGAKQTEPVCVPPGKG